MSNIPAPTCRIPKCERPASIDNICNEHAGFIYTKERLRVIETLHQLLPNATPEAAEALVTQLEHMIQMLARVAASGGHFVLAKREPPKVGEAAETPPKAE